MGAIQVQNTTKWVSECYMSQGAGKKAILDRTGHTL